MAKMRAILPAVGARFGLPGFGAKRWYATATREFEGAIQRNGSRDEQRGTAKVIANVLVPKPSLGVVGSNDRVSNSRAGTGGRHSYQTPRPSRVSSSSSTPAARPLLR